MVFAVSCNEESPLSASRLRAERMSWIAKADLVSRTADSSHGVCASLMVCAMTDPEHERSVPVNNGCQNG